jgi:GDP-L-fucose synthase
MAKPKILITGMGLLGYALEGVKNQYPHFDVIFPYRQAFDLRNPRHAELMISSYNPDVVILNAGKVGGIKMNRENPETMFYDNMMISNNIIHASIGKVAKVIAFGSGCAVPDKEEINEFNCMDGTPYEANYAYGWAKKMTYIHLKAAREQVRLDSTYIVFNSLYGENDHFNSEDGHVIPSLIRKTCQAKKDNKPLSLWGDGSSVREVTYSKDAARIVYDCGLKDLDCLLVSSGQEYSIKQIAEHICDAFDYKTDIEYDLTKPNGQKKRAKFSKGVFNKEFKNFKFTPFSEGLKNTCDWLVENQGVC